MKVLLNLSLACPLFFLNAGYANTIPTNELHEPRRLGVISSILTLQHSSGMHFPYPFFTSTLNHLHLLKSDSDRIAKELLDKIISERRIAFDQKRSVKGCGGKRDIRLRLIGIRMSNLRDDKALSGGKSGMGDLSSVSPPFDSCIERGH